VRAIARERPDFRHFPRLPAARAARNWNMRRQIGSSACLATASDRAPSQRFPSRARPAAMARENAGECHDILRNPLQKALFCVENNKQWLKTRWKAAFTATLPLSSGA